jgi:transposase
MGHQVKLIPPQYLKPYVRGNKNDYNDASAIAEAVTRPEMRPRFALHGAQRMKLAGVCAFV